MVESKLIKFINKCLKKINILYLFFFSILNDINNITI